MAASKVFPTVIKYQLSSPKESKLKGSPLNNSLQNKSLIDKNNNFRLLEPQNLWGNQFQIQQNIKLNARV